MFELGFNLERVVKAGSSQEIRLRDSVFKTYMQLYNVPVAVIAIQGGPNTLVTIYEARARAGGRGGADAKRRLAGCDDAAVVRR